MAVLEYMEPIPTPSAALFESIKNAIRTQSDLVKGAASNNMHDGESDTDDSTSGDDSSQSYTSAMSSDSEDD